MTPMKEDYVSFEVAKLLKDKGFDVPCNHYYFDKELNEVNFYERNSDEQYLKEVEYCSAPTHETAMRYLRKAYGLHISVAPYLNNEGEVTWVWEIINIETATIIADSFDGDDFDSCEEAVEAALKYVLEKLI